MTTPKLADEFEGQRFLSIPPSVMERVRQSPVSQDLYFSCVVYGSRRAFWIYEAICICGFFYFFRRLPETKSRSLEDLEQELTYFQR